MTKARRKQKENGATKVKHNFRGRLGALGFTIAEWYASEGVPIKRIAATLNVAPSTVRYNLRNGAPWDRLRQTATSLRVQQRVDVRRALVLRVMKSPQGPSLHPSCALVSRMLKAEGISSPCSASTVRRDLKALGYCARRRPKGPRKMPGDDRRRLEFCRLHYNDHRCIIFSDEKIFDCNDHGVLWQWCAEDVLPERRGVSRWAPQVHVWGLIGPGVSAIAILPAGSVNSVVYISHCLRAKLLPVLRRGAAVFQQDGATPHTSKLTRGFLEENGVEVLEGWPPRSPDLNPIENMWSIVQRKVSDCGPTNATELTEFVLQRWRSIPQPVVDKLCASFPKRCQLCVENGGRLKEGAKKMA